MKQSLTNKTFLVLFVLLFFSCEVNAQSRYGIKAGVNLATQVKTISISPVPPMTQNTKPFVGYQVGGFYKTNLSTGFSFSAEINLSVIGSGMKLTAPDGNSYNTNDKLGYLELPLFLQYSINKIYFGIGPGVGLKVFSKLTNFENNSYNISYYKNWDVTGNVLAGYSVSDKTDLIQPLVRMPT